MTNQRLVAMRSFNNDVVVSNGTVLSVDSDGNIANFVQSDVGVGNLVREAVVEDNEIRVNMSTVGLDAAQQVVNQSAGVIIGNTSIDIDSIVGDLQTSLEAMSLGGLIGLWFQSLFVGLTMNILSICIMLVVYGRMIEIYLVTSLGPIPLATMTNGEWRNVGQNYLKSLLALGFQAFLIMVVVGIYSVLIQSISATGDVSGAIWLAMGYTVLLCFCLFKTGSMAKAVFSAH